jgi:hypothetical protein
MGETENGVRIVSCHMLTCTYIPLLCVPPDRFYWTCLPIWDSMDFAVILILSSYFVTGSWNEASSYASWTGVSSGTGQRYLSDSITVQFDWWLHSWLMDLEAVPTLFDRYSFTSIVLDRFRVSCMWLDGGLIQCICLYDTLTYLRDLTWLRKRQVESPVNILGFLLPITAGPPEQIQGADTCYLMLPKSAST